MCLLGCKKEGLSDVRCQIEYDIIVNEYHGTFIKFEDDLSDSLQAGHAVFTINKAAQLANNKARELRCCCWVDIQPLKLPESWDIQ